MVQEILIIRNCSIRRLRGIISGKLLEAIREIEVGTCQGHTTTVTFEMSFVTFINLKQSSTYRFTVYNYLYKLSGKIFKKMGVKIPPEKKIALLNNC